MSIITVTPNPSLDRTLRIERLEHGEVIRAGRALVDPGGKGINVARALIANGVDATAILPVGGAEGDQLTALLRERGIQPVTTKIAGAVRANIALVEPEGTTTKINEPGPALSKTEVAELLALTERTAAEQGAAWIASCGSLPDGAPDDFHARVAAAARRVGAKVAADTSGVALAEALKAGMDLVKPNREELAELLGRPINTLGDAVDGARQVVEMGAVTVLASLGEDGALLVTADIVLHAQAEDVNPVSTSGAGDATLAGYLAAASRGGDHASSLTNAVAFGAAAVQFPGSAQPTPLDLRPDLVRVTDRVDRDQPLAGSVSVTT